MCLPDDYDEAAEEGDDGAVKLILEQRPAPKRAVMTGVAKPTIKGRQHGRAMIRILEIRPTSTACQGIIEGVETARNMSGMGSEKVE